MSLTLQQKDINCLDVSAIIMIAGAVAALSIFLSRSQRSEVPPVCIGSLKKVLVKRKMSMTMD